MKNLVIAEVEWDALYEFLEETEALIDADDGTLFPIQYLDLFEEVKEILNYGKKH